MGSDAMQFQMPNSKVLKCLMGWMLVAMFLKTVRIIQADNLTGEQMVAYFLAGLIFKFLLGAFWSGFPLVYVSAMIAAVVFVTAVLTRGKHSKPAAKFAFVTIMYLSLFCIWIEPWLAAFGIIANVILIIFGLFSIVVEICVSLGWLFLCALTYDELKIELGA
jgi:hypothetical protein